MSRKSIGQYTEQKYNTRPDTLQTQSKEQLGRQLCGNVMAMHTDTYKTVICIVCCHLALKHSEKVISLKKSLDMPKRSKHSKTVQTKHPYMGRR